MNLAFIDTKELEFLFVSPDRSDLNLANDILEQKNVDTDQIEELINYLNTTYTGWHFFMSDCRIQRTRAKRVV